MTDVLTIENQLQSFMMNQFHPKRQKLSSTEISKQLADLFMSFPSSVPESVSIPTTTSKILPFSTNSNKNKNSNLDSNLVSNLSISKTDTKTDTKTEYFPETKTETKIKLDKKSWGFWTAFILANGYEEYLRIPLTERIKFAISEKTKVSEWMVEDFKRTKNLMANYFYRLNNRDLEDISTGLLTDADEHKVGLEVLVIMILYYRYGESGSEKDLEDIVWCHPMKKVYYPIYNGRSDSKKWGIFVSEITDKKGYKDKRYELRQLNADEFETMEKEMISLVYVNKSLHAQTKYTLKDLTDMASKICVSPPLRELDEKEIALDLDKRIEKKTNENKLGIVRNNSKKDETVETNTEKWKKNDWYSGIEDYFVGVF